MSLHNPLWDFALATYKKPDVKDACLALQDKCGLSVNLLLFALWLAEEGREYRFDHTGSYAQQQVWQETVIEPLRGLRLRFRESEPLVEPLYRALKHAELEAERVQLAQLYSLAEQMPLVTDCDTTLLRYSNLIAVSGRSCSSCCRVELDRLLKAVVNAV